MAPAPAHIAARMPPPLTPARAKSAVHTLTLALVWLTVALSSLVLIEPAPVDLLTCGLILLLPIVGLFALKNKIAAAFAVLLAISALSFFGANFAFDTGLAAGHNAVSLYLYASAFIFAGFIAKRPGSHTRLVLNAYVVAATIAAVAGIVGYLDLFEGAYELLTRYDRASGPFKDPNVFGPFLVPALIAVLHLWLTQPLSRGALPLVLSGILSAGLLLSFSRGAWATAALALAIYGYLYLLTARTNLERLKLALLVIIGSATLALVLASALQSDSVARLIAERAALTQPYDEGPEGRFGGQEKAFALILDNPFGLGGLQFAPFVHHEEPHNVYLSMLLSSGWCGGVLYLALCATLLAAGWRHAMVPTRTRSLFIIAYASLAATILLGVIIDSDHWRHFYLLIGIVTGLMAGDARPVRTARIIADRRPVLMQSVLIIAPPRRERRLLRRLPQVLTGNPLLLLEAGKPVKARRPPRIRGG